MLVSSHVLSELDDLADGAVFVSRGRTVDAPRTVEAMTLSTRRWQLVALDPEHLRSWLRDHGVAEVVDPAAIRPDHVLVELPTQEAAAACSETLVRDGVPMVSQAPASGALEQVYLELESERR